jgi:putative membrane protein
MQFLKTLFWVLIAVIVVLFAKANSIQVHLMLWENIQADINLPLLVLFAFLLGWLPTYLIMRARLWTLRRRVETFERNQAAALGAEPPLEGDGEPVI